MGKRVKQSSVKLRVGDLLIVPESREAGILLQKHKVLRTYDPKLSDNFSRWYFAWRVKWNKEVEPGKIVQWVSLLDEQIDEQKLINDIENGKIEHYSKNDITCN